jgi:ABC-type uncharacterized transport system ATPase subunit
MNALVSTTESMLEALAISKNFGELKALEAVDIRLRKGTIHALLGENGAGKSTLVKCVMGFYRPDAGSITVAGKEVSVANPQEAAANGIGMVYQHFTLVENMTVAENIVIARPYLPNIIDWRTETRLLEERMAKMPFKLDLHKAVSQLSAGEKQKLEIVKQLLLNAKILILDEPTSVLTPLEADEVLEQIARLCKEDGLTVLMITHKFREVMNYADEVTVLRKGKLVGSLRVADSNPDILAEMMMGAAVEISNKERTNFEKKGQDKLVLQGLSVQDDHGTNVIDGLSLSIAAGEILGIAGVSGNGQSELVAALAGQRPIIAGVLKIDGESIVPSRKNIAKHRFYCLPEEPLRNACVGELSVSINLALRNYDQPPMARMGFLLNYRQIKQNADALIKKFKVKTMGSSEAIENLSGGNVQRAVLARELSQAVNVLVIANPCFGLDFKAVKDIHNLIMEARNLGAAVLLISEDLDEILELSDRFCVISKGSLSHEGRPESADIVKIGHAMAGHHEPVDSQELNVL